MLAVQLAIVSILLLPASAWQLTSEIESQVFAATDSALLLLK